MVQQEAVYILHGSILWLPHTNIGPTQAHPDELLAAIQQRDKENIAVPDAYKSNVMEKNGQSRSYLANANTRDILDGLRGRYG